MLSTRRKRQSSTYWNDRPWHPKVSPSSEPEGVGDALHESGETPNDNPPDLHNMKAEFSGSAILRMPKAMLNLIDGHAFYLPPGRCRQSARRRR
jgi:hypothetical protein